MTDQQDPPHDIGAEQHLLGAMMIAENVIPDVYTALGDQADPRATAFYRPAHRTIYAAILTVFDRGEQPDATLVAAELAARGDLIRVGGGPYLHTLLEGVPTATNAGKYAEIVIERWAARGVIALGSRLQQAGQQGLHDTAREMVGDWLDEQAKTPGVVDDAVSKMLGEMLTTDDLDQVATLEPLIGDVLYRDTLARVIGPSGGGKSFVCIDLAGHVATGQPWNGRAVAQGPVIYLVAEGAKGVRKRIRAWEQQHGRRMDNVLFLPRPVQADSPEWAILIEACRRIGPALVIVDTQARVTVGTEENSATEMGVFVDRMEQLRAATGACVLLVHHKGLQGEHARGSTAVKAALQTELVVNKVGKGRDTIVTLASEKQKDGEDLERISFELRQVPIHGEAHDDGRPVTSAVLVRVADTDAGVLPGGVEETIGKLDAMATPTDWGRRKVRSEAAKHGVVLPRDTILGEAITARRNRPQPPGTVPPGVQGVFAGQTGQEPVGNHPGTTPEGTAGQEGSGWFPNRFPDLEKTGVDRTGQTPQTDASILGTTNDETPGHTGSEPPGTTRNQGAPARVVPTTPTPIGGGNQSGTGTNPGTACTTCGQRLDPLFATDTTVCTICAIKGDRRDRTA